MYFQDSVVARSTNDRAKPGDIHTQHNKNSLNLLQRPKWMVAARVILHLCRWGQGSCKVVCQDSVLSCIM